MITAEHTTPSADGRMAAHCRTAGLTLVELVIGTALAMATLATFTALLTSILAARARAAEAAEAMTAVASAIDQIVRDVRLAGYDPLARGIAGVVTPTAQSVVLRADLDGSGDVDTSSEEQITYRLNAAGDALQRLVGQQNLPILSDVAAGGFRLRYFDVHAVELDPSSAGAADRVRLVTIELALRATSAHGALRMTGGARLLNR
jgi:Tfp pilus assembly protein PilW